MRRWKRSTRVIVIAAASLVLLCVGYLALGNLFLAYGLRRVVATPMFTLGYRKAWTVWPGRVHLSGFHIEAQTDTLEWMLTAETATVDLELRALTHREVHLRGVRADNLHFRLLQRVMPRDADDPKVRALPPIGGFEVPPVRLAGVADPEILRGAYRHWVVRIDDSDAHVREIWIGPYRFEGDARSRGGFRVAPHRVIALGPSTLDVSDGAVTIAGEEMARHIVGRLTCTIAGFDPDDLRERAILRMLSSDTSLDADVPSLTFLEFFVPRERVRFEDGGGPVHAEVGVRGGQVTPGSVVELESRRGRIHTPAFEIVSDAHVDWRATDDGRTVVRARVPDATVQRVAVAVAPASIKDARVAYTTADADLAAGLAFAGLSAQLARASSDIRWLTRVRNADQGGFDAGLATVSGDLDVDASFHARSQTQTSIEGAVIAFKDARLRGDLKGTAAIDGVDILVSRAVTVTRGHATLTHGAVTGPGKRTAIGAVADVDDGELEFRSGFALNLGSHAVVTGSDALLELFGAPWAARTAAGLFGSSTTTASARVGYADGLLTLKVPQAASGTIRAKGEVRHLGDATEAALVVNVPPFGVGFVLKDRALATTLEPGPGWLDAHRPTLTARKSPVALIAERDR